MIFIIKGFQTIVVICIVISSTFRLICSPVFCKCLSNSGTFTELRTTSFIVSTLVTCSDSVSHNRYCYSAAANIETATSVMGVGSGDNHLAMNGYSHFPKLQAWSLTINLFIIRSWTLVGGEYPSVEMQSMHSTLPCILH